MYENFIGLEQEKRDRIMNVAMSEFCAKGFKNASTNEIVKKAGISKGALFHYFSSKKEIFEFLYSYNTKLFTQDFYPKLETLPSDVLERWTAFATLKMEMVFRYPLIFEFMLAANNDEDSGVIEYLKLIRADFTDDFMQKIYVGVDLGKFKEGIDLDCTLEIIWWTLEGFANKMQKNATFEKLSEPGYFEQCIEDMNKYLHILKSNFYREEY